jgi:hypothetical protein
VSEGSHQMVVEASMVEAMPWPEHVLLWLLLRYAPGLCQEERLSPVRALLATSVSVVAFCW